MSEKRLRYPPVPDSLIDCLYRDFPNTLPRRELTSFEFDRLIREVLNEEDKTLIYF